MNLQQLCDAHYVDVRRFLCRLTGNLDQAEDLTQTTFLKACRAWKLEQEQRDELQLLAWLYQIAQRSFYDALRRQKLRNQHRSETAFEDVVVTVGDPCTDVDLRLAIHDTLQRLNPTHQQALSIVASGGNALTLSMQEGIVESTAAMRIKRARAAFRAQYTEVA